MICTRHERLVAMVSFAHSAAMFTHRQSQSSEAWFYVSCLSKKRSMDFVQFDCESSTPYYVKH